MEFIHIGVLVMFEEVSRANTARGIRAAFGWPWSPRHLLTRSADVVVQITCIAHRRYDWWVECDVRNPQGTLLRGLCLHPALIEPDGNEPAGAAEYKQLEQAVQRYLHIHGRWINSRWEPHDKSNLCGSPPAQKARRGRTRRHARRGR